MGKSIRKFVAFASFAVAVLASVVAVPAFAGDTFSVGGGFGTSTDISGGALSQSGQNGNGYSTQSAFSNGAGYSVAGSVIGAGAGVASSYNAGIGAVGAGGASYNAGGAVTGSGSNGYTNGSGYGNSKGGAGVDYSGYAYTNMAGSYGYGH